MNTHDKATAKIVLVPGYHNGEICNRTTMTIEATCESSLIAGEIMARWNKHAALLAVAEAAEALTDKACDTDLTIEDWDEIKSALASLKQ